MADATNEPTNVELELCKHCKDIDQQLASLVEDVNFDTEESRITSIIDQITSLEQEIFSFAQMIGNNFHFHYSSTTCVWQFICRKKCVGKKTDLDLDIESVIGL